MKHILNLHELEAEASRSLDKMALDYYRSGAADELTVSRNQSAYKDWEIHYRVLAGVSERDTSVQLFGQRFSSPIALAPTAFQKLAHPEGELATAQACAEKNILMTLSTLSTTPLEDVVAAAGGRLWFQLYVYRDREATKALVQRAEAAGCNAIVLTVDAPLIGRRENDIRNQFRLPEGVVACNMTAVGLDKVESTSDESALAGYVADQLDAGLTWADLNWLRSITTLPVLVKGVVRPDDAIRALQNGASGIIISNHGGRQLDTAPATIDVLPRIVEAIDGQCPVLIDGGIRRGTDALKALAMGAKAVLIGRPLLWGLAVGGRAGVEHMLQLITDEFDLAMALSGCRTIADITPDLVQHRLR